MVIYYTQDTRLLHCLQFLRISTLESLSGAIFPTDATGKVPRLKVPGRFQGSLNLDSYNPPGQWLGSPKMGSAELTVNAFVEE